MSIKWPIRWDLRTSMTHPLQIDWITSKKFQGKIGITLCPGKYQPVSWSGGWNRCLTTDIDVIEKTGVTTVVSLVEDYEMKVLRVLHLGDSIQERGINWIHMPFEDTTAPNSEWMEDFDSYAPSIISSVKNGDSVIVHCKGGLSRAGTFAALLLYALEIEMKDAITLIRRKRSSDCINPIQEEFLLLYANKK